MATATLVAVSRFVDELGVAQGLKPQLDEALEQLRDDFTDCDGGVAGAAMMLSEKLDILMRAYDSFVAHNKLGATHTVVRKCAFISQHFFSGAGTRTASLSVTTKQGECILLALRRPSNPGGPARLEHPGFHSEPLEAVFAAAGFTSREEPRLSGRLSISNVVALTQDELHTLLMGLCTAPSVTFKLAVGRMTLTRDCAGELCVGRWRRRLPNK